MHYWGEEGVDWHGITDAAHYIGHILRRWGRVGVADCKEKYGEVRVYCTFGWHQLHNITHPGHFFSRYPKWLWELDCTYLHYLIRPLNVAVIPIQRSLYRIAYRRALRKWPHLRDEILEGADFPELLREI